MQFVLIMSLVSTAACLSWLVLIYDCSVHAAVYSVPLLRVESTRERLMREGTWTKYYGFKQREQTRASLLRSANVRSSAGAKQSSSTPTYDYDETIYVAEVKIGTPSQSFFVVPDTGSSDFWIADSTCGQKVNDVCNDPLCQAFWCGFLCSDKSCCGSTSAGRRRRKREIEEVCDGHPCAGKNQYNSSSSSSYTKKGASFSIQYGTGHSKGVTGQDSVSFAGVTISDLVFGQAREIADFFSCQHLDGVLGLGYPVLTGGATKAVPFVNRAINAGLLSQKVISIWMTKANKTGQIGGEITLGGINSERYSGEIFYQSIVRQAYWEVKMDEIKIGTTTVTQNGGFKTISDSGTSLIGGPKAQLDKIAAAVGATYYSEYGLYKISCSAANNRLPLRLIFGGQEFAIPASGYVVEAGPNFCIVGMQPFDGNGDVDFILGDVFIRSWYQIYDFGNNRVGFAKSNP